MLVNFLGLELCGKQQVWVCKMLVNFLGLELCGKQPVWVWKMLVNFLGLELCGKQPVWVWKMLVNFLGLEQVGKHKLFGLFVGQSTQEVSGVARIKSIFKHALRVLRQPVGFPSRARHTCTPRKYIHACMHRAP